MTDAGAATETNRRGWTTIAAAAAIVVAIAAGIGIGHALWATPDYYDAVDPSDLPAGAENDLIRLGWAIVTDTASHIGSSAPDPAMRFAGNDLACANCHLDAGLKPFAAPFVSTWTSYPLMSDDRVITLTERIQGCMMRSMNGRPLPPDGEAMRAMHAYIRYLGDGTPEGVRVAGMGLLPLAAPMEEPSADRGEQVYAANCSRCHGPEGQGNRKAPPGIGWAIPPLWGEGSFNDAAGMARIETAAAFIRANMPRGVTYSAPLLSLQEAWDVAAFVTSRPRPPGPRGDAGM
jgi:thiosulfate dehydrogenase